MANSPTAGSPPGTKLAGPLYIEYDSASSSPTSVLSGLSVIGPFFESNLAQSQTNNAFALTTTATQTFSSVITMPKAGSIVGMSVNLNATFSAVAPTILVRVNNVTKMSIALVTGITTRTRFTTNLSSYVFARGDQIKVVYTSGALVPATREASVWVWTT